MFHKVYQTRSYNAKENVKYMIWTNEMDHCFSKILVEHVKKGNQLDNTIKPATYAATLAVLNKKFGLEMTKDDLKNRLKTWRKQYGVLNDIVAQKGFKWDEAQKMVVADDAIWNDYIKSIKNYEELCIIFGNDRGLVTSDIGAKADIDLVSDNEGMETAIVSVTQNDDKQAKNLRWTEEMDRCLGKVLVNEVQKGHKVDNVIQTEAYNTAVAALSKVFGPDITKDHIKNRLKTWKKQYVILKELLSHTGFRWDETQNKVIGDDSDWNDYIKTHYEAHLFRGRVVENYDHLCIIFGNHYATASYSRTADDVVHTLTCDSEGVEAINVSPIQCYDGFQYQAMNMRWTSEMDRCLSMILLEQVNLGNKRKSSNKFKPAAYVAAISALRERFQLDFTKDHVKNRIKAWRKLYSSVKKLLDQNEFHWDEKQKMVIANDDVWDDYIKIHPDVRLLQGQVIENYDELCYIIENFNPAESSTNDSEADLDWDTENEDVETEIAYQNRSDNAKERVKYTIWTDEMDRCLTEILVDQLKQGNKLEKNFKPVSFAAALTALNENFALNVTIENITSRLKTWKKLYRLVNELLSHRGFEWNEEQKMVVAPDSVWNEYIKMHPDAKSLRARSIENYNELSAIIDNNHAKACWFTSGAKGDFNPISNSEEHVETPLLNMLVDEERSVDNNTGDGTEGSFQRTKARPPSSSHSEEPFKKRRYNDVLVEMMSALAANIGRIADALTGSHQSLCLDELFVMVKNIPGFDDDLIIEACEFLSFDDKRATMFMKLNERLRKLWLLKRLRGHS